MSLGGVNALAWAGAHSRRLAGLVLVDVGPEIGPTASARSPRSPPTPSRSTPSSSSSTAR
jgi:pimeloyl-ACP methyl ester carboxylesterase